MTLDVIINNGAHHIPHGELKIFGKVRDELHQPGKNHEDADETVRVYELVNALIKLLDKWVVKLKLTSGDNLPDCIHERNVELFIHLHRALGGFSSQRFLKQLDLLRHLVLEIRFSHSELREFLEQELSLAVPVAAGAEDHPPVWAGVVLVGEVHHGTHQLGEVGGPGREVGVLEHLDACPEVRDDHGGRWTDPQAENVSIFLSQGQEVFEEVVGQVVNCSNKRKIARAWREILWESSRFEEVDNKKKDDDG